MGVERIGAVPRNVGQRSSELADSPTGRASVNRWIRPSSADRILLTFLDVANQAPHSSSRHCALHRPQALIAARWPHELLGTELNRQPPGVGAVEDSGTRMHRPSTATP